MAIQPILRMGDPRLMRVAEPVTAFNTPELHELIADMVETMRAANGAGLAAPQIGVNLQVVIFGTGEIIARYPQAEPIPQTVLINPVVEVIGDAMTEDWEGCLSVPGLRGIVPRHEQIRYRGADPTGAPIDRIASGFHARVVQHETDHLRGILYPMRMHDFSRFGFTDVLFPGVLTADE